MTKNLPTLFACLFIGAWTALADDPAPPKDTLPPADLAARVAAARKLADNLKLQTGTITLQKGLARVALPEALR
jgi:hypothetical protein